MNNSSKSKFSGFTAFVAFYPFIAIVVFAFVLTAVIIDDTGKDKVSLILHNGAFIYVIVCFVMPLILSLLLIPTNEYLSKRDAANAKKVKGQTEFIKYVYSEPPSKWTLVAFLIKALITLLLIIGSVAMIYCYLIFFGITDADILFLPNHL